MIGMGCEIIGVGVLWVTASLCVTMGFLGSVDSYATSKDDHPDNVNARENEAQREADAAAALLADELAEQRLWEQELAAEAAAELAEQQYQQSIQTQSEVYDDTLDYADYFISGFTTAQEALLLTPISTESYSVDDSGGYYPSRLLSVGATEDIFNEFLYSYVYSKVTEIKEFVEGTSTVETTGEAEWESTYFNETIDIDVQANENITIEEGDLTIQKIVDYDYAANYVGTFYVNYSGAQSLTLGIIYPEHSTIPSSTSGGSTVILTSVDSLPHQTPDIAYTQAEITKLKQKFTADYEETNVEDHMDNLLLGHARSMYVSVSRVSRYSFTKAKTPNKLAMQNFNSMTLTSGVVAASPSTSVSTGQY